MDWILWRVLIQSVYLHRTAQYNTEIREHICMPRLGFEHTSQFSKAVRVLDVTVIVVDDYRINDVRSRTLRTETDVER